MFLLHGKILSFLLIKVLFLTSFSARKSGEAHAFVLLCQLPVPHASAVDGHIAIDLDLFTSFGAWICDMVVRHTHQKISKFPEYHQHCAEVPLVVFQLIENLAIAFRPFVHPEFRFGLR